MKNTISTLLFFCLMVVLSSNSLLAQKSGVIKYKETVKMEFNLDGEGPEGIDMSKYLPESTSFYKELHFDGMESLYKDDENGAPQEDTEISSDDGSFKMVMKFDDDVEDVTYTNLKEKTVVQQTGFMGKSFVIKEETSKIKWKITGEKVKFLDYECTKATATIDDKSIVAWFAPQIPVQVGPSEYGRLPGAVLMVSVDDGKTEIMATEVTLGEVTEKIAPPKDGKKVSREQYEKIVEEKTKEMRESAGEGTFIIRG